MSYRDSYRDDRKRSRETNEGRDKWRSDDRRDERRRDEDRQRDRWDGRADREDRGRRDDKGGNWRDDKGRNWRDDKGGNWRDEKGGNRRDSRDDRRRSPSDSRKKQVGGGVRNLRIDRHECRKAAIDFMIRNYDINDRYSNERIEDAIESYIRTLEMEFDYYAFTVEILRGLLLDRKYMVITDRWVMGILDEHLQAELKVPDLTILRVAGFELLTHPEIPTTVVINEVNVLAKMYCGDKQSLIHAAVNRMIETQTSIGNELAIDAGERKRGKDDPMNLLSGLDQEAQLAMLLLDQMRRKKKRERNRSRSSSRSRSPSPKRSRPESPVRRRDTRPTGEQTSSDTACIQSGGIKIQFMPPVNSEQRREVDSRPHRAVEQNVSTQ